MLYKVMGWSECIESVLGTAATAVLVRIGIQREREREREWERE